MTNSAGRPVFQQNAFRRAGGHLYRPAGQLENETRPVTRNFECVLARGSGINMAGPPCDIWLKFCQILHCNAPDRWYNRITERGRDPKPSPEGRPPRMMGSDGESLTAGDLPRRYLENFKKVLDKSNRNEYNKTIGRRSIETTIMATLAVNHFKPSTQGGLWWGHGSLMWGDSIVVRPLGEDLYEVTTHHWLYDCDGDPVKDTEETQVLHGGRVLELALGGQFPIWQYRYRG